MEISKAELASAAAASAHSTSTPPQELMGSEALVKSLQAENVEFIWGYPGGAVLYIYDAFYKQDTIQHGLVRHEQAAVHAADGYARATGDVGVSQVPGRHRAPPRREALDAPRPPPLTGCGGRKVRRSRCRGWSPAQTAERRAGRGSRTCR